MQLKISTIVALGVIGFGTEGRAQNKDTTAMIQGQVTAEGTGAAVPGASIIVRDEGGIKRTLYANADGKYSTTLAAGDYEVTFTSGSTSVTRSFTARTGKLARVNARLRRQPGEVIVIRDEGKARRAKATNYNPRKTPRYSDKAIASNVWRKAWLLLDVDTEGVVRRAKFINRPGYDLDEVALNEVADLKFAPSLNADGKPINTLVLWAVEWPSYWWLIDRIGVASGMPATMSANWANPTTPHAEGLTPFPRAVGSTFRQPNTVGLQTAPIAPMARAVPCSGSGPLRLDSINPVYRDCSEPDLEKEFASEPWIATTP